MSDNEWRQKPDSSAKLSALSRATLGRTGLIVSRIAFGAGPVSGLMTGSDEALQASVVQTALKCGINWFDTAAGYGNGTSETNLGRVFSTLSPAAASSVHIATKVRIDGSSTLPVNDQIRRSVDASLGRLQRDRVTLLQLHNGVTEYRDDEPASLTVSDVLSANGIAETMAQLKDEGITQFIGLTGTGNPECLRALIRSAEFDTVQLPYNALNPSAGCSVSADFTERDYGNILADCLAMNLGVFAIRVFAGGALLSQSPSRHTLTTPYFPLDLYERDLLRAEKHRKEQDLDSVVRNSLRFALSHPAIHSAIIGFGLPEHVTQATIALT